MNKIVNKILLAGDKFMPKSHLRQPGITYSACRLKDEKFRETSSLKHLYRNELDKACFAHDAAYSDSKDLAKRSISVKILKDRACEISRNRKYDGNQKGLASIVYTFF